MKKCSACALHAVHLQTLALTIAASEGRIEECRRLNHIPYKRLAGKHDVCVNCLRHGWATMAVLSEVLSQPQDQAGRPLRGPESDPSRDGGIWAAAQTPEDLAYAGRWRKILWVLALIASAAAFFGLLVSRFGPR